MRRKIVRSTLCAVACVVALTSARPAAAQPNVATQWNNALLQAVRNTGFAPMWTARALACVHTSMYDAWAAYDPVAVGTRLGGSLRRPAGEHTQANKEKAISYAAYRTLVDLFPSQQAVLFDPLMAALGYDPSDISADTATPQGVGNVAAGAELAFRHDDGANQLGNMNGGAPYSDYTGYVPKNTSTTLNDPNYWQPLPGQTFLAAQWGLVTPFALTSASQLRPGPPKPYGTGRYVTQAEEVIQFSANLNDRTKAIARYWADGPTTETPPGHWNLFAQFVSNRDGHTLDQDVKMFFALGNAMCDSSIAVWEAKVYYDYIRPVPAIRFLFAGQPIQAWGGPGLGTQTIMGQNFQSYIGTPPFSEYVSGHSTFSAAGAEILKKASGREVFGACATIAAGSLGEGGTVPAADVQLCWPTFKAAADEAGISRRYGGIHFKDGDLQARQLGTQIGKLVWDKAQSYFNGTATP